MSRNRCSRGLTRPYVRAWIARIVADAPDGARLPLLCSFGRHGASAFVRAPARVLKAVTHLPLRNAVDVQAPRPDVDDARERNGARGSDTSRAQRVGDEKAADDCENGADQRKHERDHEL